MNSFIEQIYNAAYEDALGEIKQATTLGRIFAKSKQGLQAADLLKHQPVGVQAFTNRRNPRLQALLTGADTPDMQAQQLRASILPGSGGYTRNGADITARDFLPAAVTEGGVNSGAWDLFARHMGQDPKFNQKGFYGNTPTHSPSEWISSATSARSVREKMNELFKQFMEERRTMQGALPGGNPFK